MESDLRQDDSPFHEGERDVQTRLGVRDKIEAFARRVVRDYMPEQHREFYAGLPFLLMGSIDAEGRPWASLLAGPSGFLSSPDPRTLEVHTRPLVGDPLSLSLKERAEVGLLGIELETRRRNRLTGRIESTGPDGFVVSIKQAFGNCPQYIQRRAVKFLPESGGSREGPAVTRGDRFDDHVRALIERSDTLFIATSYVSDRTAASHGADVSHRGGKPGFVRVENDRSFVFPDFAGNNHFNTLGNLQLNPKAGVLFVDFVTRDLVYMTGVAEVVWEGEEVRAFAGAERLIRFRADEVIRAERSLPLRFDFGDYSPMLAQTGDWTEARERIVADKERNQFVPYEVSDVKRESETISSFYLHRVDGRASASYEPGQFLPVRIRIPSVGEAVTRTYTLSTAPGQGHYRLSIKREEGNAVVSNFLHTNAKPGFRLEAMAPRGKFVLDRTSERPVVLVSAGVGITPMMAMLEFIVGEGRRTRNFRRVFFIHGARNGKEQAFGGYVRKLATEHESVTAHVRLSRPGKGDRLGETYDSEGRVNVDLLKSVLPLDDYEFYLCGPGSFMRSLYGDLLSLGVRPERIHTESFGPSMLLEPPMKEAIPGIAKSSDADPVPVRFAASEIDAEWVPDAGTLLELAEAAGLNPDFSCRSGICGTCATKVKCGAVDYLEDPVAALADDEVLLCCATPRSADNPESCGENRGLVLEL